VTPPLEEGREAGFQKKQRTGLGKWLARATRGTGGLRLLLILVMPLFWLALFLVIPLLFVALYGFSWYNDAYVVQVAPPDPANYLDAISIGRGAVVVPLLIRTFAIAALTTVVSLVVGYAMAYYIARLAKERWRGLLMGLVVVPFWVSFIVRIYAVQNSFSTPDAVVNSVLQQIGLGFIGDFNVGFFQIGTGHMLVFTLMYVWLPFMILPLFASLSKIDPLLLEAAYDLGASRWRAFLTITLPLTYPAMIVGSILTFITCVGAFIESQMVGGVGWQLIGNYVQDQFNIAVGLPQASASAVFIIAVTVLLISFYRKYAEIEEEGETETKSRITAPLWRLIKKALRTEKPSEPEPVGATMPDGGMVIAEPTARGYRIHGPIPKASWERVLDVVAERGGKLILGAATTLMLLLFFVPLIIVAIFAFNSIDSLNRFGGFSLQWWVGSRTRDGLFQDPDALSSIYYSFVIALASSLLAVFFGTLAAYAITRYEFRTKGMMRTLMYLGLVIPSLIMGVSLAILIRFINYYLLGPLSLGYGLQDPVQWELGLASVIVGHTTFNIPLATLVLIISFREFDRTLEEAAMNLGADEITTFLRVTLPNIMPGVISAILLGFTFSFDELPVTLFLYGQGVFTMPLFIYGLISKKVISPRVNAASTIVLILSLVFVLMTTRLSKRGGQLFRI